MLTPIEQVIAVIQVEIDKWENETPSPVRGALLRCREIAKELLPTEKQVIETAYDAGLDDMLKMHDLENGKEYFNQTFNKQP